MQAPPQVKALSPEDALKRLPFTSLEYETKHAISEGKVQVSVSDKKVPSHSPYGSWLTMYFPFETDEALRGQYQLLNLNSLRMGRIMSLVDSLCADSCTSYVSDDKKAQSESYFLTAMMDGLQYQSRFRAD